MVNVGPLIELSESLRCIFIFGCLVEELSDWVLLKELHTREVLLNFSVVRNLVANRLHC